MFMLRTFKSIIRPLLFWESYCYCSLDLSKNEIEKLIANNKVFKGLNVKELTIDDFFTGDKEEFTSNKIECLRKRFKNDGFKAYGVMKNSKLVYSCWLSTKQFEMSEHYLNRALSNDEVLFLDDFMTPHMRGCGIHTAMNIFRLQKSIELGKKKAIVIILKENKPALKSQLKVGFNIDFIFITFKCFNATWSNFNDKYQKRL